MIAEGTTRDPEFSFGYLSGFASFFFFYIQAAMDPTDEFYINAGTYTYASDSDSNPDSEERLARRYWSWYTLYGVDRRGDNHSGIGVRWGRHWIWGEGHGVAYLHRHPSMEVGWYRFHTTWLSDGPNYQSIGAGRRLVYVNYEGTEYMEIVEAEYELQGDEIFFESEDENGGEGENENEEGEQEDEEGEEEDEEEDDDEDESDPTIEKVIVDYLRWNDWNCPILWVALSMQLSTDSGIREEGDNGREYIYPLSEKHCLIRAVLAAQHLGCPFVGTAWLRLGNECEEVGVYLNGEYHSSRNCYENAAAALPTYAWAWYCLGKQGGGTVNGEAYSAKECLIKSVNLDPDDHHNWEALLNEAFEYGGEQYDPESMAFLVLCMRRSSNAELALGQHREEFERCGILELVRRNVMKEPGKAKFWKMLATAMTQRMGHFSLSVIQK